MRNRWIKVSAAVPSLKPGDPSYNTDHILKIMKAHPDCGLLVFPELSITGYTCADLFQQSVLLDGAMEGLLRIKEASREFQGTAAVGMPLRFENCLYNCAVYVSKGQIVGIVPKTYLPTYGEFYEGRWFTSGKSVIGRSLVIDGEEVPFGVDVLIEDSESGVLIGTDICEDLWVPDAPSTHAAIAGANVLVNLSASDEVIGKEDYRRSIVLNQSASCLAAYLYVSSGTEESSTDLVFSGHTMLAENGRMLNEMLYPEEDAVLSGLIDLELLEHCRIHETTFTNEDGAWYRHCPASVPAVNGKEEITAEETVEALKSSPRSYPRMPFVPSDDSELRKRCETILRIQANGLATRVKATGLNTLVIGISGGLDSTLALIVAHEAQKIVPSIRILTITMPNEGNTSSQTYDNAMELMRAMHSEIREIPIGAAVRQHLTAIGHSLEYQGEGDTAYENAQARMRTYILMDTANMEGGLVVGTGDLSELALGWCTYNGDHMSMYGVNASVPKTLVQYICRAYALTCGDERLKKVLLAIVDTPISPELTPSNNGAIAQKTEDKIGKYDLNDFFLYYTLRYGFRPAKTLALAMYSYPELSKEQIKEALIRFLNRFFHQQFKRSCLPDGPKVGSVTLSPRGDWRMPSDASVNLWLDELKKE